MENSSQLWKKHQIDNIIFRHLGRTQFNGVGPIVLTSYTTSKDSEGPIVRRCDSPKAQ
jgi:hypothetical protein